MLGKISVRDVVLLNGKKHIRLQRLVGQQLNLVINRYDSTTLTEKKKTPVKENSKPSMGSQQHEPPMLDPTDFIAQRNARLERKKKQEEEALREIERQKEEALRERERQRALKLARSKQLQAEILSKQKQAGQKAHEEKSEAKENMYSSVQPQVIEQPALAELKADTAVIEKLIEPIAAAENSENPIEQAIVVTTTEELINKVEREAISETENPESELEVKQQEPPAVDDETLGHEAYVLLAEQQLRTAIESITAAVQLQASTNLTPIGEYLQLQTDLGSILEKQQLQNLLLYKIEVAIGCNLAKAETEETLGNRFDFKTVQSYLNLLKQLATQAGSLKDLVWLCTEMNAQTAEIDVPTAFEPPGTSENTSSLQI